MGSLTSTPKIPEQRVVTAVPAAAATEVSTQIEQPSTGLSASERTALESEGRTQSLLARNRSRFGTIATSFRGFLNEINQGQDARKTLLGE